MQIHRRLKGGIARGDIARVDRLGKARIQLANIVRRTLGHVLRHIAIARGNLQRLKVPTGACPLGMDSTDLRGPGRRGDEVSLAPVDFEPIATTSPGNTRYMDRGYRPVRQLSADQDIVWSRNIDEALGIHL